MASCLRQLVLRGATLEKEADAVGPQFRRGEAQEIRERGEGACCDHSGRRWVDALDTGGVDDHGGFGQAGSLAQEGCLALIGFDKVEFVAGGDREDEARETASASKVDCRWVVIREQGGQLERVFDVAWPKMVQVAFADQVYAPRPACQLSCKKFKPLIRFT